MSLFFRFISVFVLLLCVPGPTVYGAPKLVLLVSVDQLRPDRLRSDMQGGLGRLMREGRVYTNARLDHGVTNTCPGHVAFSTGVNPGKAGIPGNSYIDHLTGEQRYCVDDKDDTNRVFGAMFNGAALNGAALNGAALNRSPNALTATAIGDWLKEKSPASRVFSVAGKDRSAITMGGKNPDGAYWYERAAAKFTSSGYYGPLPDYVHAFNGDNFFVDGYAARYPQSWEHAPGSLRDDDFAGESKTDLRYSGHPLNTGELEERAARFYASPFLDLATTELAKRVVDAERLGQRGVTDLLAIAYSAADVVGHRYGPYSGESEDALAQIDTTIGELLAFLDKRLEGDFVVALSSDHGVLPLPEWLIETGEMQCPVEGGRIDLQKLVLGLYWRLYVDFTLPFGDPRDLVGFSSAGGTVSASYAQQLGVTVAQVVASMERYLEGQAFIEEVWTLAELAATDDPVGRLYRHSFVAGKSPHFFIQLSETCLVYGSEGTTHGTVYDYDRRVPLIFFGPGVKPGKMNEAVHSIDIAPTLGSRLGLNLPVNLDGQVLDLWKLNEN
ncbi:MAG: alkaline phosphatase family protein [Candidatus Azotimanducaceae bacterium WSBS_2022_MAG_OTU7]